MADQSGRRCAVVYNPTKVSDGFRHLVPVVVVVAGYGLSFYAMSMSLRSIPLGVVYAVWSGLGTVAIVLAVVAPMLLLVALLFAWRWRDPGNRPPLKTEGYLTRDPRAKERKKYGLHKARKAPQYSKR